MGVGRDSGVRGCERAGIVEAGSEGIVQASAVEVVSEAVAVYPLFAVVQTVGCRGGCAKLHGYA